jgi:hypothetical protein|tara:strand:+ start:583 stop:843 length:261 start_codon:yes stop_codon:yes gene_type:complete
MVKYTEIDNQYIIKQALLDDTIELEFTKADGSLRKMNATLQESVVPHVEADTERKANPDIQVVWDTDANGWRSFRWDRLQGIKETS